MEAALGVIDKTLRMSLLFDAYGCLLTPKQSEMFTLYYNDNLSLGEIADNYGVSRQAVYDILKRSEGILHEFEEKLGLVARTEATSAKVEKMRIALTQLGEVLKLLPKDAQETAAHALELVQTELDNL